jgi:ribosomal protein S18 acetylase RimI-like enzyme
MAARDLPSVSRLLRESFAERLHHYMVYTQRGIDEFLRLRVQYAESFPGSHALVAEDTDGAPVAFCDFRLNGSVAFLSYICVAAVAQGRGVASTMIADYLAGPGRGATRMELDVFDESKAAIALYDRLGFSPAGRQVWSTRTLPLATSPASVPRIKDAVASLERYGFCDFTVAGSVPEHTFGIMGGRVLRCFDTHDFADASTLSALRAAFPSLEEALVITGETDQPCPSAGATVINQSTRMSASLPLTFTHREVVVP